MLSRNSPPGFTGRSQPWSRIVAGFRWDGFMARGPAVWVAACVGGICLAAAAAPVRAQTGPVIAIPTRPGVPIVIHGRDASYALVEGDWGLARPGIGLTVIGSVPIRPNPVYEPRTQYHPRYGAPPARGRNEVEPPPDRPLPQPAESFYRSWSTSGQPQPGGPAYGGGRAPVQQFNPADVPATVVDPETFPSEMPEVFIEPRRRLRRSGPPP
jgi:hypothetical protein